MIHLARIAALAGLAAGVLLALTPPPPAKAAAIVMCRGASSGASPGPARWVAPASGTAYGLDNMGCALIARADVADAQANGLIQSSALRSFIFVTGVITGTTAVQITPNLPAGAYIRDIFVNNTTANAVTGGIDIGTTSGGADVVAALTCAANCLTFVADAALLKRVFSTTAQQALFAVGHTAGNSANLTLTVTYGYF